MGTPGHGDIGTWGGRQGHGGTPGHGDTGTWRDKVPWGHRDMVAEGHGDTGT